MNGEKSNLIIRNISLEKQDYQLIKRIAEEKGFGGKGFSTAIRYIIRDWANLTDKKNYEESKADHA